MPCTTWRKVGRLGHRAEHREADDEADDGASEKVRMRNSFERRTGSAAAARRRRNATIRATPSNREPMICGEPQPQVVPPSEATRTRQVATAAMRKVPR